MPKTTDAKLTPYQFHKRRWGMGCGSELCKTANSICLARGTLPCKVLFCGEGPGVSEDELGKPFAGPAGHLLDKIIEVALEGKITYAMTNLVGCIPRDGEVGKATQPPDEAIRKCTPRLKDLIWIAKPRLIVCVGALASKWLQNPKVFEPSWWEPLGEVRFVSIAHPAFLLRLSMAQRPLEVQRAIITLRDAGEELGAE